LKDNICTRGVRTTAGSRVLGNWSPPYDATAWALLADQGAVLLGKSNMDELGTGTTGKSAFGQTVNPWDTSRVPGGSSGGSAAAASAGYVPFSLGSDTGGSIRLPASYCGLYGLKPTYGLVSRYGLISYASSLDNIGPFTRDMEDMALVMRVLARHDSKDSTSVDKSGMDFARRTNALKGRRVALVKEFRELTLDQPIADAMKRVTKLFEDSGAEITEVSLPTVARYAIACYYAIVMSEAHTSFARFDGVRCGHTADAAGLREMFEAVRSEGFGKEVKYRIITGTYLTQPDPYEKYYVTATRVRSLIAAELNKAFESGSGRIDCILQPVAPSLPVKKSEANKNSMEECDLDLYTLPVNLAGLPGLSFRAGAAESGLPVGLQLIGPRWSDAELLDIGVELEKKLGAPEIAPQPGR